MAEDTKKDTEGAEVDETPVEPVTAEEPVAAEAEEPAGETAPDVEEPTTGEARATEGDAGAEATAAEASDEATVGEAAEEAPAGDEQPEVAAETSGEGPAPTADAAAKRKKKRLPRALRPARTRRKRVPSTERKPIVRTPKPESERGRRQERQGTVVSDGMDKTIVVKVDVIKAHRRYKKVVRRSVKFHAHDEGNEAKVGDVVRIVETRPLSATKRWRLVEIVEAAK